MAYPGTGVSLSRADHMIAPNAPRCPVYLSIFVNRRHSTNGLLVDPPGARAEGKGSGERGARGIWIFLLSLFRSRSFVLVERSLDLVRVRNRGLRFIASRLLRWHWRGQQEHKVRQVLLSLGSCVGSFDRLLFCISSISLSLLFSTFSIEPIYPPRASPALFPRPLSLHLFFTLALTYASPPTPHKQRPSQPPHRALGQYARKRMPGGWRCSARMRRIG